MNVFLKEIGIAISMMLIFIAIHLATAGSPVTSVQASVPLEIPSIGPEFTSKEIQCVRNAVYGEARGESFDVQVAVAATIVNRSYVRKWPNDLCAVVRQPNQFVGYSSRIVLSSISDAEAWDTALDAAQTATLHYGSLPWKYKVPVYFHTYGYSVAPNKTGRYVGRMGGLVFSSI